jgi:formylglycine-generating enzyme required for sulfatase activity
MLARSLPALAWLCVIGGAAHAAEPPPGKPVSASSALTNSIGMQLVLLPAGRYVAGSSVDDPQAEADEQTAHRVTISRPFYLGRYEVTQDEYRQVMGDNPSWFARGAPGEPQVRGQNSGRWPVDMVSWDDAVEFCRRLSQLPAEQAAGRVYRLPTEAEWEYACRAGSTTRFAFGRQLSAADANIRDGGAESGGHPRAVGSYRPNAFGLYDLHGNVWEWCSDAYDAGYYEHAPPLDPPGPAEGTGRVVRGGDWQFPARYARSANRDLTRASRRDLGNGFRAALAVP